MAGDQEVVVTAVEEMEAGDCEADVISDDGAVVRTSGAWVVVSCLKTVSGFRF